MQFRSRNAGGTQSSAVQISLCVAWTIMSSLNLQRDLHRHHRYDALFHSVCLSIFVAALVIHLYFFFFGTISLDNGSLTIRQSFKPVTLPYSAVVDAQPAFTPAGKMLTHIVELEIARVAPDVYPHEYRKLYLSDPDAFLDALRPHLQQPA